MCLLKMPTTASISQNIFQKTWCCDSGLDCSDASWRERTIVIGAFPLSWQLHGKSVGPGWGEIKPLVAFPVETQRECLVCQSKLSGHKIVA